MLVNYLGKLTHKIAAWKWIHSSWAFAVILPAWLAVGLSLSLFVIYALLYALQFAGVSFASIDATVFNSAIAALLYILTLSFVIGLPWLFRKYTTWQEIGLSRLPSWSDIGLAPVGFIMYFLASALLIYIVSQIFPVFDISQSQETGFTRLSQSYEYILAFATLIIIAPAAEELLFRGFLYGKLRKRMPVWIAILITSVFFGLAHGQWNVGLDVFVLSLVLCGLREVTGNIWAGMLLHMLKNAIAFFIIFIAPVL